jgi:hypothetical protein
VRAIVARPGQHEPALFIIRGEDRSQPAQPLEEGEAGFVPLNRGVGERLADIGLHNDVDLEQAGDRAGDRIQLIAGELSARDVGRAIDDVVGLAAVGDAHRLAIRLNLGQIVVDVAGQHRIAAEGDRAFLKRPQREAGHRAWPGDPRDARNRSDTAMLESVAMRSISRVTLISSQRSYRWPLTVSVKVS